MANGANRAFMKAGPRFLKDNIIEVGVVVTDLIKVATDHVDPGKAALSTQGRVPNRGGAAVVDPTVAAGIYDFDLFKSPRKGERSTRTLGIDHMTSVPVYELKAWGTKERDQIIQSTGTSFSVQYATPDKARPIRAYWVPWSSGSCWSVQLGNAADYFFTPTMDGCSLAISSGASPLVTHGNYKDPTNPAVADQATTLAEMTQQHTARGTDVHRTLLKDTYVATPEQKAGGVNRLVTVVGFRDPITSHWSFYYQSRMVDANRPDAKLLLQDRMVVI
jgi:hypothetical protein